MASREDFRFEAHKYLIEMDAALSNLMMLVSCGSTFGLEWIEANARYEAAHSAWMRYLQPPDEVQVCSGSGELSR
ncbi:hypothetical protein AO262_27695 [Pseudomonas fluorescens ABAC62]|nr:hypothetical protein AO262_27695 [Pseudomonas fluorescens ABAC62]